MQFFEKTGLEKTLKKIDKLIGLYVRCHGVVDTDTI